MSEALVREIANEVLRQGLLENWRTYAVLVALLLLSGVASTLISTYIRKRAETYATKADLDQLIVQLKATTAAAEQVKSAIAQADWANREWRTLRRIKLEELVAAVHGARHWLDIDMNARFFSEKANSEPSPIWKLEVLTSLYFRELLPEANAMSLVYSQYVLWIIDIQKALSAAGNTTAQRQSVFDARLQEMAPHQAKLLLAISALGRKASAIMKEIVGV